MNDAEIQKKISILKCPRFWRCTKENENNQNSWTNFFRGVYNGDICTITTVKFVNLKINVKAFVNIDLHVNYILL